MATMRGENGVYVAACDVGRGLFAARAFAAGDHILDFHGRQVDASDPINHSDQQGNLLQIGPQRYLVPEPPALFANHSCEPNAGLRHTVSLFALCPIQPDEEIRFDYSTTMDEDNWTMVCRCGAPTCRGVIRDFKYLPPDLQAHYLTLDIVQPFIARQRHSAS